MPALNCLIGALLLALTASTAAAQGVSRHQILDVKVETPGTVLPGSTVDLNLSVNRNEPTDLVVSVYDQSLLVRASVKSVWEAPT